MIQTQRKIFRPKYSLYRAAVQLSCKKQAIHIGMFLNQPIIWSSYKRNHRLLKFDRIYG